MSNHHASTDGQPVSPPNSLLNQTSTSYNADLFPNEVCEGGEVAPEGPGPDADGDELFEEWAPSAPSSPPKATPREREQHALSGHVQYRSWCPHCVRARARANAHARHDAADPQAYPVLHWDYCYLSATCEEEEKEAERRQ